jgi:hypothetical protein
MAASVLALGVMSVAAGAGQAATTLNVWGTSDITDSNLFAGLSSPGYHAQTGNTISYTAVGTGAAITAAENAANNIDAIIVHSPSLEAPFVSGGFSYNNQLGNAVFYNDYVIPGPTSDPAGVGTSDATNTVGAFEAIAASGAAGHASFVSRNDNSGTNVEEQTIWGLVHNVDPPPGGPLLQLAPNAPAGNTTRYIPWTGTGTGIPAWYVESNTTQGASLIDTNNCNATPPTYATTNGNCYTIVDRGTWQFQGTQGSPTHTSNLKIVSQNNCSSCTGGAGLLTNPFHAYMVKSTLVTNKPGDLVPTQQLISYLTSSTFQNSSLPSFPASGPEEFFPDAYAKLTNTSIPASAPKNTQIAISATLTYPPPVAQPIGGMPVQLQQCTTVGGCSSAVTSCSGGSGWSNVGSAVNSNASTGVVSFTPTLGSTSTYYRLCMAAYSDSTLASLFSLNANGAQLGTNGGFVTAT